MPVSLCLCLSSYTFRERTLSLHTFNKQRRATTESAIPTSQTEESAMISSIPTSYFLLAGAFFLVAVTLQKVLEVYLWKPLRIHKSLRAQGIQGPPFRPLLGNLSEFLALKVAAHASPLPFPPLTHNITPIVLPFWTAWSAQYGSIFLYWMGDKPRVALSDPELCKEMLSDKLGLYPKATPIRPDVFDLLGNGLAMLEGEKWAQHRRMVNPAFHLEKLKAMTPTFIDLARNMLDSWQSKLQSAKSEVEIDASEEFKTLTADIIAHTAFGSSYAEGKQVFKLQYEQQKIFEKLVGSFYFPGSRFLPTAMNRHRWSLSKQIKTLLGGIIRKRMDNRDGTVLGDDLLGLMLSAFKDEQRGSESNLKMSLIDIIDECKTFFLAGHETTSSLLTWTVMLLAISPEWQERAREEVMNLFGTSPPGAEALNQMKINFAMMESKIVLCMVLQRFRFKISPGYKHAPITRITLQPGHGMQIIVETW